MIIPVKNLSINLSYIIFRVFDSHFRKYLVNMSSECPVASSEEQVLVSVPSDRADIDHRKLLISMNNIYITLSPG